MWIFFSALAYLSWCNKARTELIVYSAILLLLEITDPGETFLKPLKMIALAVTNNFVGCYCIYYENKFFFRTLILANLGYLTNISLHKLALV